jgi:hypothetical protein
VSMTVKQFGFVPHVSVKSSTGRGRSSSPSISTVSSKLAIRRFGDSEGGSGVSKVFPDSCRKD